MLNQQNSLNVNLRTRFIVKIGVLIAIAFILQLPFFEFKMPVLFPDFLKIDLSDIPSLIVAASVGVTGLYAGLAIEILKNVLHAPFTTSQGVGEFANACVGIAYVIGVWGTTQIFKDNKYRTILSFVIGGLVMSVFASIFNYFVVLHLYVSVIGFKMKDIVAVTKAVNPAVSNVGTLIVAAIFPFNVIKCIVAGVASFGIIKKAGNFLKF